MKFISTEIAGVWLIVPEPIEDERGSFARLFCRREFETRGLNSELVQCSTSFSRLKGTLRGMHFQAEPHGEEKIVRCTRGAMYDVIADLRRDSPSFRRWSGFELTADNRMMVYVPRGVAHGFLTTSDDTEVFYQMSEFHHPESARGVRWDDPSLAIRWPQVPPALISDSDRSLPYLRP
ncbi:MAG: dTDP-4-dehydrorhamnose 3,5-epimerase [Betaproteobacteria bacterium]|nr:MAG: dTDP-4-dehydrorhamnose 3,5-epimerase [Betaproteobacteria bacterium]